MLISFIRTLILLPAVVAALRLMGKRQIGQLQPSELVITILLSQVAAAPMQDNDLPMINTVCVIAVLAGAEVLLSAFALKSARIRRLLDGSPVVLVKNGAPDQAAMRRLRYTLSDLMEALRQKDVFDLSEVRYAIAETDGSVSVLLNAGDRAAPLSHFDPAPADPGMPFAVICDGERQPDAMRAVGCSEKRLCEILRAAGRREEDVFLLTLDGAGKTNLIPKDVAPAGRHGGKRRRV